MSKGPEVLRSFRHYSDLYTTTTSCVSPKFSSYIRFCLFTRSLLFIAIISAESRTFPSLSLRIFHYMSEPLSRLLLWCLWPFFPIEHRSSLRIYRSTLNITSSTASEEDQLSRLQLFVYLLTCSFARHSGCSNNVFLQSCNGFYIRAHYGLLPPHIPNMLIILTGQLMIGDFHSFKFSALTAAPYSLLVSWNKISNWDFHYINL